MPRITISINASGEPVDQEFLTIDLSGGLTIADLKGVIEAETSFPPESQLFYFNGQALRSDTQTLEQAGIKDGEMLAMMVNRRQPTSPAQQRNNGPSPQDERSRERIEAVRQQILTQPTQRMQLLQQAPGLSNVLEDPEQFHQQWIRMLDQQEQLRQDRANEMALLNEDPLNPDSQKKIADMIRRERIEANLQYAYEHNPAVFAQVTMLYINVKVNSHPIKAFVDSGAQTTIMSPTCAEACGISHLIDERYGGIARGVGTARILGRVHHAMIQIGDAELSCAFTVMEGKDVDLLFGLDMLKRHQACLDLLNNELRFPHTRVPFLGESEIPRNWEESRVDEPTVEGPDGTEVGARSGAVRPRGSAAVAREHLRTGEASGSTGAQAGPSGTSGAASAGSSRAQQAPAPRQPTSRYPQCDVEQLVALGFSQREAEAALDATGGNVELAAGFLFQ